MAQRYDPIEEAIALSTLAVAILDHLDQTERKHKEHLDWVDREYEMNGYTEYLDTQKVEHDYWLADRQLDLIELVNKRVKEAEAWKNKEK